jgi:predicted secreted Zn-dependent protease
MTRHPSASGDLNWHVSSTCDSGACVMVARHGDMVMLGDSKQPDGPVYSCTVAEWKEFLAGAKLGDFDDVT